jgi:hypothetical protein
MTTKTTVNVHLPLATVTELRELACQFQARINIDANDQAAAYNLARVNSELFRRQRLCRSEHPVTNGVCALLIDHGSYHHSLTGDRW